MGSERSESGAQQARAEPSGVDALRVRDHAAVVYWSTDELLASVVPYLRAGVADGDKVVYVADDHPVALIADALRAAGVDVEGASARGALVLTTATDAFFQGGRFDVERSLADVRALATAASDEGFARVRFCVEMTYLLADVPGLERGVEFEARANEEIFQQFPFLCVCSFNGSRDGAGALLPDVLATHPVLLVGGLPLVNPHYRPWQELSRDEVARRRWASREAPPPDRRGS